MSAMVKPSSITWMEVFKRTCKEAMDDDVLGHSAQLSYYFFLALFPMLICVIALLGIFSGIGERVENSVLGVFANVLPYSAFDLINRTLAEVNQAHAKSKLSIGIVFSLWSASAGMSAIMDTLNAEYETRESRSFLRRKAVAIGLTCACALVLIAAAAILIAGGTTAEAFSQGPSALALKVVEWPIAIFLVLFTFALIYFFAPDVKDQKWHWITPGAVIGVALWLLVSACLKLYLHFFDSYGATYGSLGAVIALMLWFYLTGAAVLLGAEINSVLENAAADAGDPQAKREGQKSPPVDQPVAKTSHA
jgi:membrane protein